MLEARDVPAASYWNPAANPVTGIIDLNANAVWSWTDANGNRSHTTAPDADDDLYFPGVGIPSSSGQNSGPTYPTSICVVPAGSAYQGIYLIPPPGSSGGGGYGTSGAQGVRFEGPATVGTLDLRRGGIIQNPNGTPSAESHTLTVTQHFNWTGGVLNSSAHAGTVKLVGVSDATIDAGATLLTNGSDLKLTNGTVLSVGGVLVIVDPDNWTAG
jgi:hypothetical protein